MPRTKDSPALPGFRKQRRVTRKGRLGTLILWDCNEGAPMEPGPRNERWAIEYDPGGKGKKRHMHFPTIHMARHAMGALATDAKDDEWGFFPLPEREDGSRVARNGSPNDMVSHPPAIQPSPLSPVPSDGISAALLKEFPEERIIGYLTSLCEASKVIVDKGKEIGDEPDWATREKGLRLLLAYRSGTPVQRKEEVNRRESSEAETIAKIATKPGYRMALKNYIAAIDDNSAREQEVRRKKQAEEQVVKGEVVEE